MKNIKRLNNSELLEQLIRAAQGYEDGLENASAKDANRNTAIGDRVVEELERRGAERELTALFDHPIPIVRAWAAVYGLDFASEAAVPVLEDISENLRGIPAVHAMTELMIWRDKQEQN